jgi:hypothetical protein
LQHQPIEVWIPTIVSIIFSLLLSYAFLNLSRLRRGLCFAASET